MNNPTASKILDLEKNSTVVDWYVQIYVQKIRFQWPLMTAIIGVLVTVKLSHYFHVLSYLVCNRQGYIVFSVIHTLVQPTISIPSPVSDYWVYKA